MLKSKQPRKQYRGNRWNSLALMIPQELVDQIKGVFNKCEMITHMKLGYGEMTEEDVQCLRDLLNFATVLIHAGKAVDRDYILEHYGTEWVKFQNAFHSYYERVIHKHTFCATGDELKAIRSGVVLAGMIVQGELEAEMFWCIRCFLWMKDKTSDRKAKRMQVDMRGAEKQIALYGRKGWGGKKMNGESSKGNL